MKGKKCIFFFHFVGFKLVKKVIQISWFYIKGWNFLQKDTQISFCYDRNCDFKVVLTWGWCVMFINEASIMEKLKHKSDKNECHNFIDSSKVILKAISLHNENNFLFVPLAHATKILMRVWRFCKKLSMRNIKLFCLSLFSTYSWLDMSMPKGYLTPISYTVEHGFISD